MLEAEKLKRAENRTKEYISRGLVKTKEKPEYVDFFMKNADDSVDSAKALFELSTDSEKQKIFGFTSFNGLLWTVNASYYSMFYMARALLESEGIRIKTDLSVHSVTFDSIVSFFYLTGKLEKELLDDFAEAKEDATELLGKQKADLLIEDYFLEKGKRGSFTYEMGETVVRAKAKTSLERAFRFRKELKRIIMKNQRFT